LERAFPAGIKIQKYEIMIHAFNMTCSRDMELSELMETTLIKYSMPNLSFLRMVLTGGRQYTNYGNGAAWEPSMMKLTELAYIVENNEINDDDFILSVDSDVVFTSNEVFKYVNPEYGIIGILGQQPWNTINGKWAHMSGCLIFIRGDIAKKMCDFTDEELNNIRYNEFKPYNITENEDVVLSYLAMKCGAEQYALPGNLGVCNFEQDLNDKQLKSFYHLNYTPAEFLGVPVTGKEGIPLILRDKGIEL
jgi:hypothetical protein